MTDTIKKLIRLDLIALSGKQKRLFRVILVLMITGIAGAVLIDPYVMLLCVDIAAGMLPQMLFRTEEKSHSSRVFSLLPVERNQVVSARYVLMLSVTLVISLVSAVVMQISYHIHIFLMKNFYDDIISIFMPDVTEALTMQGIYKAVFALVFMIFMGQMAKRLRKYFRSDDTAAAEGSLRKIGKKLLIPILIFLLFQLVVLVIGKPAYKMLIRILSGLGSIILTLAKLGNGTVIFLICIAAGFGLAAFHYTAAVLEYDDKEL